MVEKRLSLVGMIGFLLFVLLNLVDRSIQTEQYVQMLLVFAYGILVPLTLQLVKRNSIHVSTIIFNLHPYSFVLACASFWIERGILSFILSFPWLVLTGLIAWNGLHSFIRTKAWRSLPHFLIHAGMIYVVIGGGWLSLHRLDIPILHFPDILILLTSIHFHYAAFIGLICFGIIGHTLEQQSPLSKIAFRALGSLLLVGPMFVAAGITFSPQSPLFEFLSVVEFVLPIALLSLLSLLVYVPNLSNSKAQFCFIIAFCSLFVSMSFAFLYGYGHISDISVLDIPLMVFVHGFVNSFGFSLFAILGLMIVFKDESVRFN